MINVKINNQNKNFCENIKLSEIIFILGLANNNALIVEHNFKIIEQKDWEFVTIKNNDTIEVISFVGGG